MSKQKSFAEFTGQQGRSKSQSISKTEKDCGKLKGTNQI